MQDNNSSCQISQPNKVTSNNFTLQNHVIASKYIILNLLAQRTYSSIYYGIQVSSKQERVFKLYNFKQIQLQKGFTIKQIVKRFSNYQYTIMKKCQHRNILKLYDIYQDSNYKIIISEYCNHGNLKNYITNMKERNKNINYVHCVLILRQILQGLKVFHSNYGRFCKKLNPEKILIKNGVFKLIDIGMDPFYGKDDYQIPQLIVGQSYNEKIQSWNIGNIFHYLLFNKKPDILEHSSKEILSSKKIKNVFLEDQSKLPKDIFIFLSKCLCLNPKQRLSWRQLCNHQIFQRLEISTTSNIISQVKNTKKTDFTPTQQDIYIFKHEQNPKQPTQISQFIMLRPASLPAYDPSQNILSQLQKQKFKDKIYDKQFNIKQDHQQLQQYYQQPYKRLGFILQLQLIQQKQTNLCSIKPQMAEQICYVQYLSYCLQILKIQQIIKMLIVPLKYFYDVQDSTELLKYIYLLSSRCFTEASKLKSLYEKQRQKQSQNNNYIHSLNLNDKITKIYKQISEKHTYYGGQLTKNQNGIFSIIKSKLSSFNLFQSKLPKQNFFFSGIQKIDYLTKDQIQFTMKFYQNNKINRLLNNKIRQKEEQMIIKQDKQKMKELQKIQMECDVIDRCMKFYDKIWEINVMFQEKYDAQGHYVIFQKNNMISRFKDNKQKLQQILMYNTIEQYIKNKIIV